MKVGILVVVTGIILLWCNLDGNKCSAQSTSSELAVVKYKSNTWGLVRARLINMWNLVKSTFAGKDSFIGRCIGAAKGLKVAMPLILIKLGVILTIVAFLAVFALKGLGLLIALLVLNVGGFFSKLALFKHEDGHKPQSVHLHVHNKGYHGISHSGYDEGWSDKSMVDMGNPSSDEDRTELYNLYKRLALSRINEGNYLSSINNNNNYDIYKT